VESSEVLSMSTKAVTPTGPGLGMNLLPDAQKIRPPLSKPISMRPHFDGFVVDQ
jgi:galactonate dehydratase